MSPEAVISQRLKDVAQGYASAGAIEPLMTPRPLDCHAIRKNASSQGQGLRERAVTWPPPVPLLSLISRGRAPRHQTGTGTWYAATLCIQRMLAVGTIERICKLQVAAERGERPIGIHRVPGNAGRGDERQGSTWARRGTKKQNFG